MKRTVSLPSPRTPAEAGFTLTEMVAALLVASMLMVGLGELTRRYATTMTRVRAIEIDRRSSGLLRDTLAELERADPDSVSVAPDRVSATIGGRDVDGRIDRGFGRGAVLHWSSARQVRDLQLPSDARFVLKAGRVSLLSGDDTVPLASVRPLRDAPFDCQFDTISRECR